MSVSQFPNATPNDAEKILDLLVQLVPTPDPAVKKDLECVLAAYLCAAAEFTLSMPKLAQYHTLDPAIVGEIKNKLDACR